MKKKIAKKRMIKKLFLKIYLIFWGKNVFILIIFEVEA